MLAIEDSTKDGFADRRQRFAAGARTRLEVDTNGDRKPDVWIHFDAADEPELQYEDSDFDGVIDVKFDLATEEPLELNGDPNQILEDFGKVSCRNFSAFWRN